MAPTKTSKVSSTSKSSIQKHSASGVGAPSQLAQSSRKGKKAWRKNIDIQPVEQGLESLRSEERVIGCGKFVSCICLPSNRMYRLVTAPRYKNRQTINCLLWTPKETIKVSFCKIYLGKKHKSVQSASRYRGTLRPS